MGKKNASAADKVFIVCNAIFMILVIMLCVFPFFYLFARATSDTNAIWSGRVFVWPVGFHLENFRGVVEYVGFFDAYLNTIIYTATGTVLTLIITALCAYPLSKKKFVGRAVFMVLFVGTMFFNGGLIPNFILISRLGLTNSMWALVLPITFNHFFIILLMGSIQAIPQELEEAAAMDGMNPFNILIRILLPLCKPVLATISLFCALNIWNDWFSPMIYLHSNEKFPVMLLLRNIIMGIDATMAGMNALVGVGPNLKMNSTSLKSAAILLTVLPITAIYPFVQKYFVQGMTLGSIKA
jgi:putative aldouronate transport system permease protein